jgi:hypothetical protein
MSNQFESTEDAQEAVLFAASNQDSISKIQEMAIVKAVERDLALHGIRSQLSLTVLLPQSPPPEL